MRKLVEKDSKYLLFWFVFNWWENIYLGRKVYAQRSSIIIIILRGVKFYAFQDSMAYRRRTKKDWPICWSKFNWLKGRIGEMYANHVKLAHP